MTNTISTAKVHENLSLQNLPNEIFKDIPEYEGLYQVSNFGRVKSLKRKDRLGRLVKERIRKLYIDTYSIVGLIKKGKEFKIKVHQLVAMAFLNHKPCGYKVVVDHIDNDPLNNRLENLQIISHRENISKDRKGGTSKYTGVYWHKSHNKWLSSIQYNKKHYFLGYFNTQEEASKWYQNALKSIKNGTEIKVKKHKCASKYMYVYYDKIRNNWVARPTLNGNTVYIGSFLKEIDAHNKVKTYLRKYRQDY